jgi:uncharacterized membrane protein YbhN (UPF0104 family)
VKPAAAARSTLVRGLLTAGILAYLVARIDMSEALGALGRIRLPHLAFVLVLVGLDRLVMISRWVLLLRSSHEDVPFWGAARIFLVSSFVGSFLPAGLGADAARAYAWSRQTTAPTEAVASVAIDRVLGLLSIVGLGLVGLAFWVGRVEPDLREAVLLLTVVIVIGSAGVWWADAAIRRTLPATWQRGAAGQRMLRFADSLARYRGRRNTVMVVFILSVLVQLLRISQAYVLGRGIGIDVPFGYYMVFMPIGLLILMFPVSISGFGLPQGVIVWLLRPLGVSDALSFALSTLIVLTGLAGNLPGAVLCALGRKDVE